MVLLLRPTDVTQAFQHPYSDRCILSLEQHPVLAGFRVLRDTRLLRAEQQAESGIHQVIECRGDA